MEWKTLIIIVNLYKNGERYKSIMEVKYMEIFEDELNKLTYCTEVTTAKSLNKFTDKIKVFYHKYITGEVILIFILGEHIKAN